MGIVGDMVLCVMFAVAPQKQASGAVNAQLIASLAGIVVSGVVGPQITVWATRRWDRRKFLRDQAAARRDQLRDLLDQAASLLGSGLTNLRLLRQAQAVGAAPSEDLRAWRSQVFPLGQRLRLYLPEDDPVVVAYERVRQHLAAAVASADGQVDDEALDRFEAARDQFLELAHRHLMQPLPEKEQS